MSSFTDPRVAAPAGGGKTVSVAGGVAALALAFALFAWPGGPAAADEWHGGPPPWVGSSNFDHWPHHRWDRHRHRPPPGAYYVPPPMVVAPPPPVYYVPPPMVAAPPPGISIVVPLTIR